MALSATQEAVLTASLTERTDDGLDYTLRTEIADAIKYIGAQAGRKWVTNNRTKVIWRIGEKPTIFLSEEDRRRYNGWFVTSYGIDAPNLVDYPSNSNRSLFYGVIGIQYVYSFYTGKDVSNSEDVFDYNVALVLRGLRRLGKMADCPLQSITGSKMLTRTGDNEDIHFFNGQLKFNLVCY